MKLYAVSMMKNEEDVAKYVLYHLVTQGVDGIIVADNLSTDKTVSELMDAQMRIEAETDVNVLITTDRDVAYTQSEKMTKLGQKAHDHGADWIIPFDADELWYGVGNTLKAKLEKANEWGHSSAKADYWNHRITKLDEPGNPFVGMKYRENVYTGFYKTAYKYQPHVSLSNGNHFIVPDPTPLHGSIVMRHFPLRSEDQFVSKITNGYHACRALSPTHDLYNGAGWSPYFPVFEAEGEAGLRRVYKESYHEPEGFTYDPAPFELESWMI